MNIDGIKIGQDEPPYIVAELSANHGGSIDLAKQSIKLAKESGASAVKIQTYTPDTMTIDSRKSDLGLNPQIDGQMIRLPVPELNEERRTELKKLIKSTGEKCKVSIRNIRREANEDLKKLLKTKEISEDEEKTKEKKIQTITDEHIKAVDEKVSLKEKEIMTI